MPFDLEKHLENRRKKAYEKEVKFVNKRIIPHFQALELLREKRAQGYTLEQIAKMITSDGFEGPTLWSVHRWLAGKVRISKVYAIMIIKILGRNNDISQ